MKKNQNNSHRRNLHGLALLFFISLLFIQVNSYGKESVWVRPYEINFSYEVGNTNDAIKIKNSNTTYVPVPEWKYNGGNVISEKFAYIKEQSSRKIKVSFDSNCTSSMHLILKLTTISGTGIGNKCNYFIGNYTKKSIITLNLDGSVPGSVGKYDFTWKWEIYAMPMDVATYCAASTSTNTSHTYYTLLSTPQTPMTEPWTGVLDKACVWANGLNSADASASKITETLSSSGYVYDIDEGAPHYGTNNLFKLSNFILNYGSPLEVNCLDLAKAVTTFGNAIGCDLYQTEFHGGFALNSIIPIGITKPTNNPFSSSSDLIGNDCRDGGFSFHAFSQNANKVTWDACLKYNIDIEPDNVIAANPLCGDTIAGFDWKLPCNESESTYIKRLVDDWTYREPCANRLNCGYFLYRININIE